MLFLTHLIVVSWETIDQTISTRTGGVEFVLMTLDCHIPPLQLPFLFMLIFFIILLFPMVSFMFFYPSLLCNGEGIADNTLNVGSWSQLLVHRHPLHTHPGVERRKGRGINRGSLAVHMAGEASYSCKISQGIEGNAEAWNVWVAASIALKQTRCRPKKPWQWPQSKPSPWQAKVQLCLPLLTHAFTPERVTSRLADPLLCERPSHLCAYDCGWSRSGMRLMSNDYEQR